MLNGVTISKEVKDEISVCSRSVMLFKYKIFGSIQKDIYVSMSRALTMRSNRSTNQRIHFVGFIVDISDLIFKGRCFTFRTERIGKFVTRFFVRLVHEKTWTL